MKRTPDNASESPPQGQGLAGTWPVVATRTTATKRNWSGSPRCVLSPTLLLTHCVTSGKFLPLSGISCSICKMREMGLRDLLAF